MYDAATPDAGINVTQLAVLRCISRREGEPLARGTVAKVTRKGARLLEDTDRGWDDVPQQVIGRFGKTEWRRLVDELDRLAACAEKISAT